ncbi:MAG: hypothetical protein ACHQ7N_21530 [Candidatus Methylomirabilales bacterium]
MKEPSESFECWLLRRVAQAVEAGEVPGELVAELHSELMAARERPQTEGHAAAIQHIADLAGVPEEEATKTLATMAAQPRVTQELLLQRIAEAWLEAQRKAYRFLTMEGEVHE